MNVELEVFVLSFAVNVNEYVPALSCLMFTEFPLFLPTIPVPFHKKSRTSLSLSALFSTTNGTVVERPKIFLKFTSTYGCAFTRIFCCAVASVHDEFGAPSLTTSFTSYVVGKRLESVRVFSSLRNAPLTNHWYDKGLFSGSEDAADESVTISPGATINLSAVITAAGGALTFTVKSCRQYFGK